MLGLTRLLNLTPAPNTTLAIPGLLSVVLNEQVRTTSPGTQTLTVNAVHIKTLLGIDIVLSQSRCTIDP